MSKANVNTLYVNLTLQKLPATRETQNTTGPTVQKASQHGEKDDEDEIGKGCT